MFVSVKALLGYVSLLGLVVPSILGAPAPVDKPSFAVAARGTAPDASSISTGVTDVVKGLAGVKNACGSVPEPYRGPLIEAYIALQAVIVQPISADPSTCVLGGAASGTLTIIPVLTAFIDLDVSVVIAQLSIDDGVAQLCGLLPGGLVPGHPIPGGTSGDEALFEALCAFLEAIATALKNNCAESVLFALITALNILLQAIVGLFHFGVGCSCLISSLIATIDSLVGTLLLTLGLLL
ncbi:hypothetical protein C8R45DRAFT_1109351 [Mycena sanguinolenta]|nr:hypothetical protein C8R45DRAFT_1109351 [Mycena sanguinolenta]